MPMMRTCQNGHSYDSQLNTFCPRCPIPGLDGELLQPRARAAVDPSPSRPYAGRPNTAPESAAPRSAPPRPKQQKTFGIWPDLPVPGASSVREANPDPVVGWLVAHKGPALGRDFRIRWGNNAIGRGPDQPISISDDPGIHTRDHAFILYSPRNNRFRLRPGTQRGVVYLDGIEVADSVELRAYSVIELGTSGLIFVPLCFDDPNGAGFQWEFGGEPGLT